MGTDFIRLLKWKLINIIRQGSTEVKTVVNLRANQSVLLEVVYICTSPWRDPAEARDLSQPALMRGLVSYFAYELRLGLVT